MKISLAVSAYTIAQFISTTLCSAYTTLLQKVTRYACDYHTYEIPLILSLFAAGGTAVACIDVMTSALQCIGTTFVLIVLIRSVY